MTEQRTPKESLAKSMLNGMTWQYISIFGQALLNLLVLGILSRLLAPETFGLMGIAAIFVGLAELFSELGVGPAIIQHRNLTDNHLRVGFTLAVLLGAILVVILWISAPLVAIFFKNDQVTPVLHGIGFDFLLGSFGIVSEGLIRRKLQFQKLMWVNISAYALGYAVVGVTMALSGFGVWALVGATLSQSFLKSIFMFIAAPHSVKPSFARQELRDIVHFGGGITLARLFSYIAGQGDYFVVGRMLGTGPLGIYTRAYRLMLLPSTYLGRVLDSVLFPVMAKIQNEIQRLTKAYLTGVALIGLMCAPIGILMVIMAPEIVHIVLGSQWSDTIVPFQILAFGILARVSYKIDNSLARALGSVYERSFRDAIYAVSVVVAAIVGLRWGLRGVAAGVLGAVVLNDIMAIRMSLKLLNCSWREYVKTQMPGMLLALIIVLIGWPTAILLRSYETPDLVTLLAMSLTSGLIMAGFFYWRPQSILGVYGTDAVIMIFKSLPSRLLPKVIIHWYEKRIIMSAS